MREPTRFWLLHHAHIGQTAGDSVRLSQALAGKGVKPLEQTHPGTSDGRHRADPMAISGQNPEPMTATGQISWPRTILLLRHQLTILQRRQPRRPDQNWADRAMLATLLAVIPKARRQGLRLLVTPDAILRCHRDIVRRR